MKNPISTLRQRVAAADRRHLLAGVAGMFVALAAGLTIIAFVIGGGEDEPPPKKPLIIAAPATLDDVFNLQGQPAELPAEDVAAIEALIKGYLEAATIEPLEHDPDDEESPAPTPLATYFTEPAAARLETDDRLALADDHLPRAEHGVSTERANLDLAALLGEDGSAQLVAATIDVSMVVRTGDDDIIVDRAGDLVLERVEGDWRIGGYEMAVERIFASETTTTQQQEEASFR